METGFEGNENLLANGSEPISVSDQSANGSEQWEKCKIIKYSETEFRVVSYNKSKNRKTTGKTKASATNRRGLSEPTEDEIRKKLYKNTKQLYGYLMANEWEYTVVFYDVKKNSISALSDSVRSHCKNKGYKIKYINVPVDTKEGFYFISVVSGVPVEVLQTVPDCRCYAIPFNKDHVKEITGKLQYRRNERSFFPSQKLNEPEEIIIENPKCYAGDITTSLYAVSTMSSYESALYFVNEGISMNDVKKYDKADDLVNDKKAFDCLQNEFKVRTRTAITNEFAKNAYIFDCNEDDLEYRKTVDKRKNLIWFGAVKNNAVVYSAVWFCGNKNWEEIGLVTLPVVYYWENVKTGELVYVGRSMNPVTRDIDHLAKNNYKKRNIDGVYDRYMIAEGIPEQDLKAMYLRVDFYKDATEVTDNNGTKKMLYDLSMPVIPYVSNDWHGNEEILMAEARLQKNLIHKWKKGDVRTDIFLGADRYVVLKAEEDFEKYIENGYEVEEASKKASNGVVRLATYLEQNYEYKKKNDNVLKKCMHWWKHYFSVSKGIEASNGFVEIEEIKKMIRSRVVIDDMAFSLIGEESEEQKLDRHKTLQHGWNFEDGMRNKGL